MDEDEWRGCDSSSQEFLRQSSEHPLEPTSQGLLHFGGYVTKIMLTVQSAGRYVPPHLRDGPTLSKESSELQTKLSKKLKGLLNR
jgi:hypothetical protein